MRLLLDTHVLLWWLAADPSLGDAACAALSDTSHEVLVSAATAWEIGIKGALGKLRCPDDLELQLARQNFTALPVTIRHGLAAGALPPLHRDPFDRMLVAQAQCESLAIVTRDESIAAYGVPVLPA